MTKFFFFLSCIIYNQLMYTAEHIDKIPQNSNIQVQSIKCVYCDNSFPHKSIWDKHMISCHLNDILDDQEETYCTLCDKNFKTKQAFNDHNSHVHEQKSKQTILSCFICYQGFKRRGCLEKHLQKIHLSKTMHNTIPIPVQKNPHPKTTHNTIPTQKNPHPIYSQHNKDINNWLLMELLDTQTSSQYILPETLSIEWISDL